LLSNPLPFLKSSFLLGIYFASAVSTQLSEKLLAETEFALGQERGSTERILMKREKRRVPEKRK
jgi:hypothetical protein